MENITKANNQVKMSSDYSNQVLWTIMIVVS